MSIARSVDSAKDWHTWIPRTYADGTSIGRDGNPICDGRSDDLGRAYRIIQSPGDGHKLEISSWLKSYEEEHTEMPRHELFIYLSLSEKSLSIADALLRKWMTRTTTIEDMKILIAEVIPSDSRVDDPE